MIYVLQYHETKQVITKQRRFLVGFDENHPQNNQSSCDVTCKMKLVVILKGKVLLSEQPQQLRQDRCKSCIFSAQENQRSSYSTLSRVAFENIENYYQSFIYSPTYTLVSCLENNIKIYIKIYIETAPKYFGVTVTPSPGSAFFVLIFRSCFNINFNTIF